MRTLPVSTAVVLVLGLAAGAPASTPAAEPSSGTAVLSAPCLDSSTALSVEEDRLDATLPRNDDPSQRQPEPFAQRMIAGAGFQRFGPALVRRLCHTHSLHAARRLVERHGERLWRYAVRRAQSRHVRGPLPASDDRPLYWARLQATAAVRQWDPSFALTPGERAALITALDKAAHGMTDLDFAAGRDTKRVLMSGFDPYTLDGGRTGPAEGSVGNNIRHGNPSGAAALAMDGTTFRARNGTRQVIEAYTLPVNYTEFAAGYLEDTVGPLMAAAPGRRVDASVTVSQAGGDQFNLEQWNGRYHGDYPGNDLSLPCPEVDGAPQLAVDNHDCNTQVVDRWGGPSGFDLHDPPQWTTASLPVGRMIRARTGAGVPRPPGDTWPDESVAFGVVWHTNYTEFPDCSSTETVTRNDPPPVEYPPAEPPTPPDPGSCSFTGGGGNYLSNESAYRNTLLRDRLGVDLPAGHIHTPDMQHFDDDNLFEPSDDTFDAWRRAIVEQTENLVHVVGAAS